MKAAYEDNFVTAYCGDAIKVMRGLPAGSVHCCVTSPPYWALRSYLADDHPKKKAELGLEKTPGEYVERLVKYFRAVKRLLRKDGSLWLNLGDSYATGAGKVSTAPGGGKQGEIFKRHFGKNTASPAAQSRTQPNRMPLPGFKPKDMVGIPWMVAFVLRADGWYLRSEIIWNKPNPMPESVTDRPTKTHEVIFLFSRSPRYYYDAEAIKEEVTGNAHDRGNGVNPKAQNVPRGWDTGPGDHHGKAGRYRPKQNASFCGTVTNPVSRRNKRSVWTVAKKPYGVEACLACRRVYDGAEYRRLRRAEVDGEVRVYCACGAHDQWKSHYATFPPKLILPCILAGTSERGCCPKCGAPWLRVMEKGSASHEAAADSAHAKRTNANRIALLREASRSAGAEYADDSKTVGWKPSCRCGAEANKLQETEPCVVLDPFAGSGTTGQVARETGRKAILIELNFDDVDLLIKKRFKQELLPLGAGMSQDVPQCPKGNERQKDG